MKVLVAVGSKHGATREIADEVALMLESGGLAARVVPAGEVSGVEAWDAVVLGSAVYAGRWVKDARRLAEREAAALCERPVWVFSSGPIGDPPEPSEDPPDFDRISQLVGAIDHRVFTGKLDRARLGLAEKAVVSALGAPDGDFRDWQDVRDWAEGIAAHLSRLESTTSR